MRKIMTAAACAAIASMGVADASAQRAGLLKRLRQAREARSVETDGAVTQALRFGGMDRSYLLLDAHRGAGPAPLVVLLHGGGGNGGTMMVRWVDQARAAGLVVVAPNGVGRLARMGTWNAGGCCGGAAERDIDDVGFIGAVIDDGARRAAIDPTRIYVVGHSNGGMLTHRVAIALGNRIAAAAVVSGALFGNESQPIRPVPMLIMHGEKDTVVGFQGGLSQTGFVARAQTMPYLPTRQSVDFWRRANGCVSLPAVTRGGGAIVERSTGCASGADVVFYDLPEGLHEWSGANSALNATTVIWKFFSSQAR